MKRLDEEKYCLIVACALKKSYAKSTFSVKFLNTLLKWGSNALCSVSPVYTQNIDLETFYLFRQEELRRSDVIWFDNSIANDTIRCYLRRQTDWAGLTNSSGRYPLFKRRRLQDLKSKSKRKNNGNP